VCCPEFALKKSVKSQARAERPPMQWELRMQRIERVLIGHLRMYQCSIEAAIS
jgi:hypothetical protein